MSRANWRSLGKQRDAVSKVCDFIRGMERELFQGAEMDRHRTSRPAGRFHRPMVVTMRPIPEAQVQLAGEVTARYAHAHGAPLHAGSPETIGIADLGRPDYGDPVAIHPGEVPVFWACGVTPQAVALEARPELMITQEPGIMFLTDLPREGDSRS